MTTIIEGYDAIIEHFIDEWDDETPIALPNQYFDVNAAQEFVRILIIPMTGEFAGVSNGGFSNRLIRHEGEVVVQVLTEIGTGLGRSNELCQLSLNILKQSIPGVELLSPSVRDLGDDGEGFYHKQVVFNYRYDFIG